MRTLLFFYFGVLTTFMYPPPIVGQRLNLKVIDPVQNVWMTSKVSATHDGKRVHDFDRDKGELKGKGILSRSTDPLHKVIGNAEGTVFMNKAQTDIWPQSSNANSWVSGWAMIGEKDELADSAAKNTGAANLKLQSITRVGERPKKGNKYGTVSFAMSIVLPEPDHLQVGSYNYKQSIVAGDSWLEVEYCPEQEVFLLTGSIEDKSELHFGETTPINEVKRSGELIHFTASEIFELRGGTIPVRHYQTISYATMASGDDNFNYYGTSASVGVSWSAWDLSEDDDPPGR